MIILLHILNYLKLITTFNSNYMVYLNLEKFNRRFNLIHVGITFKNDNNILRYDFNNLNNNNYLTYNNYKRTKNDIIIINQKNILSVKNNIIYDVDEIITKDIYWGNTSKSFNEIINFEKKLHKKYILGIYDCRHYVNDFCVWSLDKNSPIWNLDNLWINYEQ